MNDIQVSFSGLNSSAETIKGLAAKIQATLDDTKQSMNRLPDAYESENSRQIQADFNALAGRFEEFTSLVEDFSKFLTNTVQGHEDLIAKLRGN